jgi:hypothetical protein
MTALFRLAPVGSVKFGPESFWTMHQESARRVAEVEAKTPLLPANLQLFTANVIVADVYQPPQQLLALVLRQAANQPSAYAPPALHEAMLRAAEQGRKQGCSWTQFASDDKLLHLSLVYMGTKPIVVQPLLT